MTDYQHSFSRTRPEQAHLPFVIFHWSLVIGHFSSILFDGSSVKTPARNEKSQMTDDQ